MDVLRPNEAVLGPYRVLDLTDEQGLLAGKLLGDLGADVIKIEPVGGDPARRVGPFFHDQPHPERSLHWLAFNLNKRGITLNLASEDGRRLFLRLLQTADFVIESFPPGYMERLGLGYEELSRRNPGVIVAAITPFGQSGPYRDFKTADLINEAMGGFLYLSGDEDRPPVRISFPISYSHAGAEAAAACAMALYDRARTGLGQFIDVSIQQCIALTTMNTTVTWDLVQADVRRGGSQRINPQTGLRSLMVWPCLDGYISFNLQFGPARAGTMRAIVAWMDGEGKASDYLKSIDWATLSMHNITQAIYDAITGEVGDFLKTKSMDELYRRATADRLLLGPIVTAQEMLESPQLQARGAFVAVDHPELGATLQYPNAFVKMSAWSPRIFRKAPLIGEHNEEIYCGELGLSREELVALAQAGTV